MPLDAILRIGNDEPVDTEYETELIAGLTAQSWRAWLAEPAAVPRIQNESAAKPLGADSQRRHHPGQPPAQIDARYQALERD